MQIRLRLFATYREIVGSRGLTWSARDGITLRELVDGIVAKYPRLADHRGSMLLAVNEAIVSPDRGDVHLPPSRSRPGRRRFRRHRMRGKPPGGDVRRVRMGDGRSQADRAHLEDRCRGPAQIGPRPSLIRGSRPRSRPSRKDQTGPRGPHAALIVVLVVAVA